MTPGGPQETNSTVGISFFRLQYAWASGQFVNVLTFNLPNIQNNMAYYTPGA